MADAPDYYVLGVEDPEVGYRARLIYERDQPLRSWMSGRPFESPPPEPIVLKLSGTDEADWVLGDLWLTPITVMSRRLLEAVRGAGVDNLDTYAVELHDPISGEVHTDFVAFNLVGAVSLKELNAARAASNGATDASNLETSGVWAAHASAPLMFRLADSLNAIMIHESVCDAIEDAGIDTLAFYEPEDWAG